MCRLSVSTLTVRRMPGPPVRPPCGSAAQQHVAGSEKEVTMCDDSGGARRARPAVTIHYAQTLDGRIATRTHSSQWISGDASLALAHRLRAEHDAVMVGLGTVVAEIGRASCRERGWVE